MRKKGAVRKIVTVKKGKLDIVLFYFKKICLTLELRIIDKKLANA